MSLVRLAKVAGSLAFVAVTGCGSAGPELYTFSGKVTHEGQPVPAVVVTFVPKDLGVHQEATATADSQGNFTLMTGSRKGVAPGESTVVIVDQSIAMGFAPKSSPEAQQALKKFGSAATSQLKIDVTKNEENFELKLD